MSKKQPQFVEITDENQSKIQQFPRQISKSVVINTQIQAQASERQQKKKLAPKKKKQKVTKKKIIVLVIAIIGIIWMALFLDKGLPDDPSKIVKQVRIEGKFEFDQKIGKKFAWIKQKIDHFDDYSEQLFFQRLFIDYDEKMMKKNPPIILFIHQPSTVQTIQQSYTIQQYAKKKNAVLMCLQMRYFGESLPFGKKSFSTQNLKYLSISQMVEDVAFIINKLVQNEMFSITQNNIWIINGAKISGTIAAMVRSKYPQLTNGAIASSPLLPTVLAPLVGEKIYNKVGTGGKRCRVSLQKLKKDIQDQLSGDRKEGLIYQVGKGIQLSPQQILYIFISRINQIQKEAYLNICEGIEDNDQLYGLLKVALFTQEYFAFDPITYSSYELMMEEQWLFFDILREQRALWYLRCSQFGLFEVPPISKSYNPQAINETFFRNRCKKIFNANLWPNPQKTLKEQFRSLQTATNLLIIHGFYDVYYPYALKGKSKGTTTIEQKCIKCQSKFDYQKHLILSKQIQKVLNTQRQTLDKWIKTGKN